MPIVLVRHASAGHRHTWDGDDSLRPLDAIGRVQAMALVDGLSAYGVTRIVSSPHVRSVQTVEPLAAHLGLPIEERAELADGADRTAALAMLRRLDGEAVVVACTHRAVIGDVIGSDRLLHKGTACILEATANGFVPAAFLPAT